MTEPKGRGADWTEERGTSDEGRRRLQAPRRLKAEPKGRGADWTEERGTSDEGRRRLQAPRRLKANTPECHDEVCVTCSDTAVVVTVTELLPDGLALVDTGIGQEEVSVALVTAVVGDTILVHAGEAIAVVPA
jgi:hydrogenase expression/formation protein HypC